LGPEAAEVFGDLLSDRAEAHELLRRLIAAYDSGEERDRFAAVADAEAFLSAAEGAGEARK
jgi:hypothetical protein